MKKLFVVLVCILMFPIQFVGCAHISRNIDIQPTEFIAFGLQELHKDTILLSATNGLFTYNPTDLKYSYISAQPNRESPLTKIVSSNKTDDFWVSAHNHCIYYSNNNGFDWKYLNNNLQLYSNSFEKFIDKVLHPLMPSFSNRYIPYIYDILILSTDALIYCCTEKGFYRYKVGERSWKSLSVPISVEYFTKIIEIPNQDALLMLGNNNTFYFFSCEESSFEKIDTNLDDLILDYSYQDGSILCITKNSVSVFSLLTGKENTQLVLSKNYKISTKIDRMFNFSHTIGTQKNDILNIYTIDEILTYLLPSSDQLITIHYSTSSETYYFLSTNNYLYQTQDFILWDKQQKELQNSFINGFCQSESKPNPILAFTHHNGVFYSYDNGQYWKPFSKDLLFKSFLSIVPFGSHPNNFIGNTKTELYIFSDNNAHVVPLPNTLNETTYKITSLLPNFNQNGIVISVWDEISESSTLYSTYNEGISWVSLPFTLRVNSLSQHKEDELLIGTNQGLFIGSFHSHQSYPLSFPFTVTKIVRNQPSLSYFIGTLDGLWLVSFNESFTFEKLYPNLTINKVSGLVFENVSENCLFISSGEYVYQTYNQEVTLFTLPDEVVSFLPVKSTETLFVSTNKCGYKIINLKQQ